MVTGVTFVALALRSPGCPSYAARAYHCLSYTQTNVAPNRSLQKWFWENNMVGGEPVGHHPGRLRAV